MIELLNNLHFIRPLWLLTLVPALLMLLLLWRNVRAGQGWQQVIDPALLPHLLDQRGTVSTTSPLPGLLLIWVTASLALAGPSWDKIPQPVLQKQDALVIVLDMSFSMYAEDLTPNRLQRVEHKLLDLLEQRSEGTTALIAYAGDSHVVSPLTDDTRTIANLLPALTPRIMPVKGNKPQLAIEQAVTLLQAAAAPDGHIVLVTDGVRERDVDAIADLLAPHSISLSVLGVGTSDGGPIQVPGSGLLKNPDGSIVIAGLERRPLRQLASDNRGRYADISLGESDLEQVLARPLNSNQDQGLLVLDRSADTWHDMGYWLVLALIPAMLLVFRRGWILCIGLLLILPADRVVAADWQDLWLTPDQRGAKLLTEGEADAAARAFENPDWRAAAAYRSEDYEGALSHYASADDADSWYNRGNALARSGKMAAAIEAYAQALQRNPELEDAAFNKQLLEQMQQQQDQQQNSDQDQEQDQEQNQDQDQQQDQQQQDQQGSDQQQNPQDSEQQQNPEDSEQQDQQDSEQQQQNQQDSDQQDQQDQQQQEQQDSEQQQDQQQEQPAKPDAQDDQEQQEQPAQPQPESEAEQAAKAEQERARAAEQQQAEEDQQKELATEQWLRRVPDDPSGLLERKFRYESQKNQQQRRESDETIW